MRRVWTRLIAWLRREEYVKAMVARAASEAYQAGAIEGGQRGYADGYVVGRAHGQLEGRQALTEELQVEFGIGGGERKLEADDVVRIASRLRH